MCGIFGLIGNTKQEDHEKVYGLLTALACATASRGKHATGYATIEDGDLVIAKAPLPADEFIKTTDWTSFKDNPIPSFFIGHCRWATHGNPSDNANNHPFWSEDGRYALIHNGIVNGHESIAKEEHVTLKSQCDSEVILRVLESKPDPVAGIEAVFNKVFAFFSRDGACALLDKKDMSVRLFRSSSKPCYVTRVPQLGNAVVFASTETIARAGIEAAFGIGSMEKGFDLFPARVYSITLTDQEPKIETIDIDVKIPKTSDFFSNTLDSYSSTKWSGKRFKITRPSPAQGYFAWGDGEPASLAKELSRIKTTPEQCHCQCGNSMWLFPKEVRICKYCKKFFLSPGAKPQTIAPKVPIVADEEEDSWIRLHCETCGLTFQQKSVHRMKCIKCGSTFVSVLSIKSAKTNAMTNKTGIWKCTKCGIRLISTGKPKEHLNCKGTTFMWEGELENGAWDKPKDNHTTTCQECGVTIPRVDELDALCQICKKRRSARREYPVRCTKCGRRFKACENPKKCKCTGTNFVKDW